MSDIVMIMSRIVLCKTPKFSLSHQKNADFLAKTDVFLLSPPSIEDDVLQALIFLYGGPFDAFIVEMPLERFIRKLLCKEDDA